MSGSRAYRAHADLLIDGSDGDEPTYSADGRTLRRADAIAQPFHVAIAHEHDEDDSLATTTLTARLQGELSADRCLPLETQITNLLRVAPQTAGGLRRTLGRNASDIESALSNLFAAKHIRPTFVRIGGRDWKSFELRDQEGQP